MGGADAASYLQVIQIIHLTPDAVQQLDSPILPNLS